MKYLLLILLLIGLIGCREMELNSKKTGSRYTRIYNGEKQYRGRWHDITDRTDTTFFWHTEEEVIELLWTRDRETVKQHHEEIANLKRLLKEKPEYCDICEERIIEKYYLDEKEETVSVLTLEDTKGKTLYRVTSSYGGSDTTWIKRPHKLTVFMLEICEVCGKKKPMGWLAKKYYERKCGK